MRACALQRTQQRDRPTDWRGMARLPPDHRKRKSLVSCDASKRLRARAVCAALGRQSLCRRSPQPFAPYCGGPFAMSQCGEDPRPRPRPACLSGKYPGRQWWWPGSLLLLRALQRVSLQSPRHELGQESSGDLRVSKPQRPQDVGRKTGRKLWQLNTVKGKTDKVLHKEVSWHN